MLAKRLLLVATVAFVGGALGLPGAPSRILAADTAPTSLESGTHARPIIRKRPRFPRPEADAGIEGWVEVSYVVKPDGSVGETLIENSSGRKAFERATIKSIKDWRYEPATMNGKPIEQCHTRVRIMFTLEEGPGWNRGAKKSFKNHYKRARKLLEDGKLDEAHTKIDEIATRFTTNHYERARLSILRSMLEEKQGDMEAKLTSLKVAALSDGEYLEPEVYGAVLLNIFNLQIHFQEYADALGTFETLEHRDIDPETVAKLEQIANQIEELRTSDQALAIEGEIGAAREEHHGAGMWWHTLLRRTAGIEEISGSLERVELRCDWRRVKAKPEKGRAWRIPPEWGDCSIYVFGEPGSTFQLLEYASSQSMSPANNPDSTAGRTPEADGSR
jgi:TonB family protein